MACLDSDVLGAWVDGTLADGIREQALAHVADCATCRRAASALAQLAPTGDGERRVEPILGGTLGRYRIERVLGRGGMGIVVAAHDPELARAVAIKILRPRADEAELAALEARLRREARVLAQLRHPNIVPVYDAGRDGDRLYVVMELIDGASLRSNGTAPPFGGADGRANVPAVDGTAPPFGGADGRANVPAVDAPADWRAALAICISAARGLAALHAAGFAHRDIKPDNILLARDGRVLVADLGLAVPIDDDALRLTRVDVVVGTPHYMAPEQAAGARPDARADQYAFAVTAQEVIGGAPRRVQRVLERAGARNPSARYAAMGDVIAALEVAARPPRRWPIIATAVALAGAIGLGAFAWIADGREDPMPPPATARVAAVAPLPATAPKPADGPAVAPPHVDVVVGPPAPPTAIHTTTAMPKEMPRKITGRIATIAQAEMEIAPICLLPGPDSHPVIQWGKIARKTVFPTTVGGLRRELLLFDVATDTGNVVFDGAEHASEGLGTLDAKLGDLVVVCVKRVRRDVALPDGWGTALAQTNGYGPLRRPPILASHEPPLHPIHGPKHVIATAYHSFDAAKWPLPADAQLLFHDSAKAARADGRFEMYGGWIADISQTTRGRELITVNAQPAWFIATFAGFDEKLPVLDVREAQPHLFSDDR